MLGTDDQPDSTRQWFGVFEASTLRVIKLPSTLTRIESRAFRDCGSLKEVKFPDRLKSIGSQCFYHSGLSQVALPPALEEVQEAAFYDSYISSFECKSNTASIGDYALGSIIMDKKTVKFPDGVKVSKLVFGTTSII